MEDNYKYKGQPLSSESAKEILLNKTKHSERKAYHFETIVKYVCKVHKEHGGLPSEDDPESSVDFALSYLSANGHVCEISDSHYEFPKSYPNDYQEIYGSGDEYVYLYYFEEHRGDAELIYDEMYCSSWRCKIGKAEKDPERRVKSQTSGYPEPPIIGLLLRTDDCATLEKVIHKLLKYSGKHIKVRQGEEWFMTNPRQVAKLWNEIERLAKDLEHW